MIKEQHRLAHLFIPDFFTLTGLIVRRFLVAEPNSASCSSSSSTVEETNSKSVAQHYFNKAGKTEYS